MSRLEYRHSKAFISVIISNTISFTANNNNLIVENMKKN